MRGTLIPALMLLFFSSADVSLAQSIDISSPSPIRASEIVGTIAARDLGDSRLTDHFYTFIGTPGDVLITVKSNNLNGDVDLFTAGSLRPLMKFTLYAESSAPVTRALFLRKREDLILRVQARSPNDDEGVYQIRLGGSFEPIAGEDAVAEAARQRISTIGEVFACQGLQTCFLCGGPHRRTAGQSEKRLRLRQLRSLLPRMWRYQLRLQNPRRRAEAPAPPATKSQGTRTSGSPQTSAAAPSKSERSGSESYERAGGRRSHDERRYSLTRNSANRKERRRCSCHRTGAGPQEPLTGPRLIIEMQDGTRVERFMSTIRRVTVENNQIVVVRKDGMIERTRMSEVLRMAIEP